MQDEFSKMHEKIAKDGRRPRATPQAGQKFKDFQGYRDFDLKGGDGLNVQRKTLEEQEAGLGAQVRSSRNRFRKLERPSRSSNRNEKRD
jgi:hypothetical protein